MQLNKLKTKKTKDKKQNTNKLRLNTIKGKFSLFFSLIIIINIIVLGSTYYFDTQLNKKTEIKNQVDIFSKNLLSIKSRKNITQTDVEAGNIENSYVFLNKKNLQNPAWLEIKQGWTNFETVNSKLKEGVSNAEIMYLLSAFDLSSKNWDVKINELSQSYGNEIESLIETKENMYLIQTITLILLCIWGWIELNKNIIRPLTLIQNVTDDWGNGDLTKNVNEKEIKSKELKQLLQAFIFMRDNLKNMISNIKDTSNTVNGSTKQILESLSETSKSSTEVANRSNDVAQSVRTQLESVSLSSEKIDNVIDYKNLIINNMNQLKNNNITTNQKVNESNVILEKVVKKIEQVGKTVDSSIQTNTQLQEKSVQIQSITNVITDISDKTNLLSLNAAIESARAGQYGRGFSVVASEIRNLSERSSKASANVAKIVSEIQEEITNTLKQTKTNQQEVQEGVLLIHSIKENLLELFEFIRENNHSVSEVDEKISSLSSNIDELSTIINSIDTESRSIDNSAQENASSSEEQISAIYEIENNVATLSGLSNELINLTNQFRTN